MAKRLSHAVKEIYENVSSGSVIFSVFVCVIALGNELKRLRTGALL